MRAEHTDLSELLASQPCQELSVSSGPHAINFLSAARQMSNGDVGESCVSSSAVGPLLGMLVGMSLLFPLAQLVRGVVEVGQLHCDAAPTHFSYMNFPLI